MTKPELIKTFKKRYNQDITVGDILFIQGNTVRLATRKHENMLSYLLIAAESSFKGNKTVKCWTKIPTFMVESRAN